MINNEPWTKEGRGIRFKRENRVDGGMPYSMAREILMERAHCARTWRAARLELRRMPRATRRKIVAGWNMDWEEKPRVRFALAFACFVKGASSHDATMRRVAAVVGGRMG